MRPFPSSWQSLRYLGLCSKNLLLPPIIIHRGCAKKIPCLSSHWLQQHTNYRLQGKVGFPQTMFSLPITMPGTNDGIAEPWAIRRPNLDWRELKSQHIIIALINKIINCAITVGCAHTSGYAVRHKFRNGTFPTTKQLKQARILIKQLGYSRTTPITGPFCPR